MKTTLWTRDDVERARTLLAGLETDVQRTLGEFDRAVARARECQAAFDAAPPDEAGPLWIELVHALEALERATKGFERVARETADLNGRLDYTKQGAVKLSGTDEKGRLVEWTAAGDEPRPEPAEGLEPQPAPESAKTEDA